jgi:hypothetical protein
MNQLSPPIEIPAADADPAARQRHADPNRLRLALVLAIAASAGVVLALTLALAPPSQREPDLVRLLRGMVLIKGSIGLAAAALVWWRLGRPIAAGLAARYLAALCVSMGAVGWLWGLHWILPGSALFYLGLLGVYLTARRDPLLGDGRLLPRGGSTSG